MNLAIGETTAEQIKMQLGCAMPLMTEMSMEVRGRDLTDGLPRNEKITSAQVEEAIKESILKIVDIVKSTLEKTPPELSSDIMEKGIVLAGGGALIKNLDKLLKRMNELGLKEEDYSWYLDTRRYGTVVHSGFGLGFERLVMYMTGMSNIRDVIPFPRTPGNCLY